MNRACPDRYSAFTIKFIENYDFFTNRKSKKNINLIFEFSRSNYIFNQSFTLFGRKNPKGPEHPIYNTW